MAAPLIAAGIMAGGALLGQLLANKSREEAEALLQSVRDEFGRIDPAKVKQLHAEQLSVDPQYDAAARDSLGRMDESIAAKGMTIQDQAALNDVLEDVGRQNRAQQAHIMRDAENRGAGSSANTLLGRLVAQQGAAGRAHSGGLAVASDAARRYWQNVRDRFGMAQQAQGAQSAIDRWNATSRTDAARYANELEQGRFDNDIRKAAGKAGLDTAAAGRADAAADRTAAQWGNAGVAAGQGYLQYEDDEQRRARGGY